MYDVIVHHSKESNHRFPYLMISPKITIIMNWKIYSKPCLTKLGAITIIKLSPKPKMIPKYDHVTDNISYLI